MIMQAKPPAYHGQPTTPPPQPVSIFEMSFKTLWPVLVVAGAGLIAWGATTSRVSANEAKASDQGRVIETIQLRQREDRGTLITVSTKVGSIDDRMKTMEGDLKQILKEMRKASG